MFVSWIAHCWIAHRQFALVTAMPLLHVHILGAVGAIGAIETHFVNGEKEVSPALQSVQPSVDANVDSLPAAQKEHVADAPPAAVLPAAHDVGQSVPAAPVFPTAQSSHAENGETEVFPAPQLVQEPPV